MAIPVLIPFTWWLSRTIRARFIAIMVHRQTCWRCGYNLQGNPEATNCPECGANQSELFMS
jgi:rubrerythrin